MGVGVGDVDRCVSRSHERERECVYRYTDRKCASCVCVCVCVDLTDTYVYKCVRRSYISIYVCTYVIQIHLHISPTNAHVCRGRD